MATRAQYEESVLEQIRKYKGFSIFWVTDNQARACAATRLVEAGIIKRKKSSYPWCAYSIVTNK